MEQEATQAVLDTASAFEAGRAHERGEMWRLIGTGVQVPSIPWAESVTVTPPSVEGQPWEASARRRFHAFVCVCGTFRHVGQTWERVDLEVEVDDFESGDPEELGKVAEALTEAARLMEAQR